LLEFLRQEQILPGRITGTGSMTAPFMGIEAVIREQAGEFPFERGRERYGRTILRKALLILRPKSVKDKTGISSLAALLGITATLTGTEIGGPGQGEDIEIEIPGNIPGRRPAMSGVGHGKRDDQ